MYKQINRICKEGKMKHAKEKKDAKDKIFAMRLSEKDAKSLEYIRDFSGVSRSQAVRIAIENLERLIVKIRRK
jgi:hypothetical protein